LSEKKIRFGVGYVQGVSSLGGSLDAGGKIKVNAKVMAIKTAGKIIYNLKKRREF
jgi:hypothetical protein